MLVIANPAAGNLVLSRLNPSALSSEDRTAWRRLAQSGSISAPFIDEPWVGSWIEAFQPREPLLLAARDGKRDDDPLVGLAALQRLSERWAGRRVSVIQSLTNVECTRFDFLAPAERQDVLEQLWRFVCTRENPDVIRLDHLPEGSATLEAGLQVARELGWRWHVTTTFESPWRVLAPAPATWDEGLERKFKSNLRNREKRIQGLGEVTFEIATGADLPRAFEKYYELDRNSWKSQHGTAVYQQANVKEFYQRLIERAPEQVWIPVLSVAGEPAAAQFLLVQNRTIYLQKTAYNLNHSQYAPGQLLTARLVRHGLSLGMEALDFLAANMTWKSDWAPLLRPHYQLLLFAPSLGGRYAYWMRYGVRQRAKRIPGLQKLVRALSSA